MLSYRRSMGRRGSQLYASDGTARDVGTNRGKARRPTDSSNFPSRFESEMTAIASQSRVKGDASICRVGDAKQERRPSMRAHRRDYAEGTEVSYDK